MIRILIFALPLALSAQIQVTATPMPRAASQRLLGKRTSKAVMLWTCTLENAGTEAVSVAPSAVLRRIPQLQPYDHETMALLIEDGSKNSAWARGGRAIEDAVKVGAFLAASRQIRWGPPVLTGFNAFLVFAPYAIQRFQGSAVPASQNFERLAWVNPLQLGPGDSGSVRIFTAAWNEPKPVEFIIETSKAQMKRSIQ